MKATKERIESELRKIAKRNGGMLRPADVVAAAESPTSPLHARFQWDDTEAAREFRLWQARKLIMSVRVEILPRKNSEPINVRAFVSLSTERFGTTNEDTGDESATGYRETLAVVRVQDLRAQMLEDALAELQSFRVKYGALKELAEVFVAMDRVRK